MRSLVAVPNISGPAIATATVVAAPSSPAIPVRAAYRPRLCHRNYLRVDSTDL